MTGEAIANDMGTTRATLRADLTFLRQIGLLEARPRVGYCYREDHPGHHVYRDLVNLSVKDYQSLPVVHKESSSAYNALVSLFMNNIGTLFIVQEDGYLEGVISRKDLLKIALGSADMQEVPLGVIMTRMPNIIMTTPNESLWDAARKLIIHEIDALPVVKEIGKDRFEVIGRFTKTNVTHAFVNLGYGELRSGRTKGDDDE